MFKKYGVNKMGGKALLPMTAVRIPTKNKDELIEYCDRLGLNVNQLINHIIEEWLNNPTLPNNESHPFDAIRNKKSSD